MLTKFCTFCPSNTRFACVWHVKQDSRGKLKSTYGYSVHTGVDEDGIRLRKRYGKDRDSLFTFMSERDVPPTNNGSEQAIRPSTTFRKVTGGFRSNWGPDFHASVRSVLNTGRRQGMSA